MDLAVVVGGVSNGANLGTGDGVFAQLSGSTLEFKSLVAGANITLTASATEIVIATAAGVVSGSVVIQAITSRTQL